jgi:hypothetical protein
MPMDSGLQDCKVDRRNVTAGVLGIEAVLRVACYARPAPCAMRYAPCSSHGQIYWFGVNDLPALVVREEKEGFIQDALLCVLTAAF